jgi:hypothetical protein
MEQPLRVEKRRDFCFDERDKEPIDKKGIEKDHQGTLSENELGEELGSLVLPGEVAEPKVTEIN